MHEWAKQNLGRHYFPVIIGIIVLFVFGWLYYDAHRNDGIDNNTDATMEQIENRINGIESRINRLSDRIDNAEKAVNGISERIEVSTGYAEHIKTGIGTVEKRLDDAIQRSGRIKNLIEEIERTSK